MKLSLPKAFSIIFFEFFIAILFNFPFQALLAENSVIFLPEDCSKYGIWDASTSVCTLQQDLKGSVEIKSDNITLDCAYHQIEGAGTGKGILIEKRKGVTIQNCKITNFSLGISIVFSSGNNLFRNEVFGNNFGIEIFGSCPDFISRENTLTENHVYSNKTSGIIFRCSYSNKLIKNNIENNGNTGLLLSGSDNFLRENSISNHQYNFGVERALWSKNFTNRQDIDTSNTINGKPIYFLVNEENKVIDSSFNPGYIGLVNSQNITIRDITLSQNVQGIYFDHTTNSKIENVKLLNNSTGLDFHVSSNNLISESEISENLDGILLWLSNENIITKNFISQNKRGIVIQGNANSIIKNNISQNNVGLYILLTPSGDLTFLPQQNRVYHNNFQNKFFQAYSCCSNNFFDNYYPSGGNYWVDYKGTDSNYGPNQDQPGSDGIGDQPFCFAEKVCDKYPLMKENGWILPKVLISEVYYNVSQDKGKEGENEWIIIHNLEEKEIEIFGWQICDNEKCDFLPDTLLPANNFAIITPTSTTFNSWKIPASMIKIVLNSKFGSHGLANDGDRVILKDANGRIVDAISYGKDTTIFNPSCPNVAEGKSLLRFPQDKDTDTFEDFIEADPTILNKPPIPVIQFSPKNPVKGTKVKFDASPSTDPNGEILNFEWQIASSTFFGTTTEFTFPENGEYEIKLTVTDDNGTISSTSTTIKVEPFSFAIITDLHIGRQYQKDYQGEEYYLTQRLRNVVSWINQHKDDVLCGNEKCKIKFLTVLGDITDNTSLSGFCKGKEILDQLEIPYIPVFGNHDVGTEEEYEQFSKWKGQDYFDQVFWSTSSIPCPNATSTKNFETLLREFNFERDEQNKDYKNFSFSFGGFSFIGLDFVSREKFMKFGSGVGSDAVLNEINKNWLEKKLEEFRENPLILFAHHPLRKNPIDSFSPNELSILEEIADNYFIPFQLGGHIHSFEDWFLGKLPSVANANIIYNDLQKIAVLTTESLMVGSNGRGVEEETAENGVKNGRKGIVRIVQVLGDDKVKPNNWETTINPENIRTEFVAFNPKITEIEYKKFCDSTACMEFESDFFTEKPFTGCWKIGNSSIFCGDNINFQIPEGKIKCSGSQKELNCEFSEAPTTTTITLFAGFGSFFEQISKTIKIELNKFPKLIKISKEKIGQIIMKSYTTGRDLIEKGRSFKDKVIAFVKHSPEIPVAIFEVDFEKAKDDIDLSTLIIDSNLKTKKAILYMENWPSEAERSKILFLPK